MRFKCSEAQARDRDIVIADRKHQKVTDDLELMGTDLGETELTAGGSLELALVWHATRDVPKEYQAHPDHRQRWQGLGRSGRRRRRLCECDGRLGAQRHLPGAVSDPGRSARPGPAMRDSSSSSSTETPKAGRADGDRQGDGEVPLKARLALYVSCRRPARWYPGAASCSPANSGDVAVSTGVRAGA